MRIVDYQVVTSSDLQEFERLCMTFINASFTPLGGISVSLDYGENGFSRVYAQAFIDCDETLLSKGD